MTIAAVLAFPAQCAQAQDFPSKSVRMVAGMAAGGGADAHAGTPRARIATLNHAINTALSDAEYRKQMAELGVVLVGGTPAHFQAYLATERKKWSELIQKQGIKVD